MLEAVKGTENKNKRFRKDDNEDNYEDEDNDYDDEDEKSDNIPTNTGRRLKRGKLSRASENLFITEIPNTDNVNNNESIVITDTMNQSIIEQTVDTGENIFKKFFKSFYSEKS